MGEYVRAAVAIVCLLAVVGVVSLGATPVAADGDTTFGDGVSDRADSDLRSGAENVTDVVKNTTERGPAFTNASLSEYLDGSTTTTVAELPSEVRENATVFEDVTLEDLRTGNASLGDAPEMPETFEDPSTETVRNATLEGETLVIPEANVTVELNVSGVSTEKTDSMVDEDETDSLHGTSERADSSGESVGDSPATILEIQTGVSPPERNIRLDARMEPGLSSPPSELPAGFGRSSSSDRDSQSTTRATSSTTSSSGPPETGNSGTASPDGPDSDSNDTGPSNDTDTPVGDDESDPETSAIAERTNESGAAPATLGGVFGDGTLLDATPIFGMAFLSVVTKPWFGLLSSAAVLVADWLGRFGVLFRFGREATDDALSHETRAAIHDRLTDAPGRSLTGLSEDLEVPISTLRHHLRVLEDDRMIVSRKQRGNRRYYPLGAENEALSAALEAEASAAILDSLNQRGTATVGEIADAVDRSYSTVSYHLSRLSEEGIIIQRKDGRQKLSELAPEVAAELASVDTSAADAPSREASAD